ncbi:MAG: tetratricopeptide repeat protein [Chitinophagales bacterium]
MEAENAFNSKEYEAAIPLLIEVDKKVNGDFHIDIALGIAYLETNELDKAYEEFNQVYNSDALIRRPGIMVFSND